MATHEEMVQCLNDEFDSVLTDMKTYVLQLQLKSERQRCALWIKKLCETNQFMGLDGRRLRNNYSKALLNMLKRGIMEGPLLHRPPEGKLQPFPEYLSEYLKEPVLLTDEVYPDWLEDLESPRHVRTQYAARQRVDELLATRRFEEQLDSAIKPVYNPTSPSRSPEKRKSVGLNVNSQLDEITMRRTASGSAPYKSAASAFHLSSSDDEQEEPQTNTDDNQHVERKAERREERSEAREGRSASLSRVNRPSRSPPRNGTTRSPTRSPERYTRLSKSPERVHRVNYFLHSRAKTLDTRDFDREVDLKVKVIENRLYEEKLVLQQKTDEEIQKILERKNAEIDDLKSEYRRKMSTAEDQTSKLERKIASVLKDAQIVRENKDLQISELKKMVETSAQTQTNTLEKRMHDLQAEHEQEKIEMQKTQTASIQQLMDDTSARLCKMEDEYRQQSKAMSETIRDLEKRLQTLTLEAERVSASRQQLEQNKIELEYKYEQLTHDHNDYKLRIESLERENRKLTEDNKHALEMLQEKSDSQLSFTKKEHQLQISKNNDHIMSLEQQLIQTKQTLADEGSLRQRQVRELEQSHKQDKLHLENLHDKKVRAVQKEMEQLESEHKKRLKSVERNLSDKERELNGMREQIKTQSVQAEHTLKDLRREIEQQQEQTFSDMRKQVQEVERELESTRKQRIDQTSEFEQKISEIKSEHLSELRRLQDEYNKKHSEMELSSQHTREQLIQKHQQELELLKKNYSSEKSHLEEKLKQRRRDHEAQIGDLSEQIADLKEDLSSTDNSRKQQLMEIGMAKDEETQKLQQEHKRAIDKLKNELEAEKLQLQKLHSSDMESQIDKTSDKLKKIESDYTERIGQQAEQIADLELQLEQLQNDKHKLVDELESKVIDNSNRWDEEKRLLRKQSAAHSLTLKQEIESLKTRLRQSERDLQNLQADHEEDLVQLRLDYEEKMKGLMPREAREQLEATTNSLKNQVNTLKQRIAILQDS